MLYENEQGYLQALRDIKENGETRNTRNGTTRSTFGVNLRFDIRTKMPLLTTKTVYWKSVLRELLWFISGNTNSYDLSLNNVHIWNGNSSRRFLDSQGLHHYQVGDCGPIYGYQWRHFNAPYRGCNVQRDENAGGGVDQLQNCIDLIRNDPTSRRIFMSAWNPEQLNEMCLPPCHVSYQFYVNSNDEISCILYQRSGDMFLGVPFNIASTAFLVNILAHMTGKKTGFVSLCIGDAHIYESHLTAVNEQLSRDPTLYEQPSLDINCEPKENIDDYKFENFDVPNYNHHPSIRADMIA